MQLFQCKIEDKFTRADVNALTQEKELLGKEKKVGM